MKRRHRLPVSYCMPMNRIIVPLLLLLCLCGCASSETVQVRYNRSSDTSTYESARTLMGSRDLSGGLASGQRVMWKAWASCSGEACVPEEVALVFYNDSNTDLNLDYRHLQLDFDGTSRVWEDLTELGERVAFTVPRGEFVRVSLTRDDFTRVANATLVEIHFGRTGTSVFSLPFDRRATLRTFAAETGLIR